MCSIMSLGFIITATIGGIALTLMAAIVVYAVWIG